MTTELGEGRQGLGRCRTHPSGAERSWISPLADSEAPKFAPKGGVLMKKNRLFVRIAAAIASFTGLLLAGGAGFGIK